MLFTLIIAALVMVQPVIADAPAASPSALSTAAPVEDPKVTALAKGEFTALQQGKINRSHYTDRTSAALTDALVAQTGAQLAQLGDLKSITLTSTQQVQGATVYVYALTCANGNLVMTLALNKDGLIDGLFFRPA
jgi:hypothetical protein